MLAGERGCPSALADQVCTRLESADMLAGERGCPSALADQLCTRLESADMLAGERGCRERKRTPCCMGWGSTLPPPLPYASPASTPSCLPVATAAPSPAGPATSSAAETWLCPGPVAGTAAAAAVPPPVYALWPLLGSSGAHAGGKLARVVGGNDKFWVGGHMVGVCLRGSLCWRRLPSVPWSPAASAGGCSGGTGKGR